VASALLQVVHGASIPTVAQRGREHSSSEFGS
jgi:hypothetical protein